MGENLLGQFRDTIEIPRLIADVNQSYVTVLEDLNKRMKVQEVCNTEENMMKRNQAMAEVQNHLGQ